MRLTLVSGVIVVALLVIFIQPLWVAVSIVLWSLCSIAAVMFAYAFDWPMLFRKRQNGRIPIYIRWLFIPYLLAAHLYNWFVLRAESIPPVQKVTEGLYVGGRLPNSRVSLLQDLSIHAVLDLTAEFDGLSILAQHDDIDYLNIPVLDHLSPKRHRLKQALHWLARHRQQGRNVLVHCALGRGRSVMVVAAYLLASGNVDSTAKALKKVQEVRHTARLNRRQLRQLNEWQNEGLLHIKPKTWVIANPVSGGGKWSQMRDDVDAYLSPYFQLEYHQTSLDQSAAELAKQALHLGVQRIIVCGGDGTVSEVAGVVANRPITLGLIPMGTANALCHVLYGLQSKFVPVQTACSAIIAGETCDMDMAYCNDEPMLLAMGLGLEEYMINFAQREVKDRWGQWAYVQGFIDALQHQPEFSVSMTLDNETFEVVTRSLVVANASPATSILAQGNGAPEFNDGYLDVTWIESSDKAAKDYKAIGALSFSSQPAELEDSLVQTRQAKRISLLVKDVNAYVLDGEEKEGCQISIDLKASALKVYCPETNCNEYEAFDYNHTEVA